MQLLSVRFIKATDFETCWQLCPTSESQEMLLYTHLISRSCCSIRLKQIKCLLLWTSKNWNFLLKKCFCLFCFIHFIVVSHQCKLELKPLEPVYRDVCVVIPQLECSMSVEYDQFSTVRDVLHQVLSLTDPPLDPTEGYSLYHVRLRMK